MLLLYLALILTIGQAFLNAEVDASYLEADMLIDIEGIFYSGGGYVSHGEGAALTWGWNKYFNRGKGLADLFSDISVSTNSGGGWFFNDVMYSQKFVELIEEPNEEKYLDLIVDYYYGIISQVYDKSIDTIHRNTDNGYWTRFGYWDAWALFIHSGYHSWEDLVTKFHYMYDTNPVLPLKNCKWTSLFGLGTSYNDYTIVTGVEIIDNPQKSSWSKSVPGFIDYTFESASENPTFEVQFPILDNWHNSVCSNQRTKKECGKKYFWSRDIKCMDHAYCDEDWKVCICKQGYTAYGDDADSAFCGVCIGGSQLNYPYNDGIKSVLVTWEKDGKPTKPVDVDTIKQLIHDSINDPKKYSGPSSCALAEGAADHSAYQKILHVANFEGSWQTAPLTKEFDDQHAPKLSLLDGGGEDNCGLTGLVRRIQSDIAPEDMESHKVITIIGMCTLSEVSMLITDMNDSDKKNYEIFEFRDPNEPAQLQFNGTVVEVWGYKVRTMREGINGIKQGTKFNIFSFSFPYTTKRSGVCRNIGTGIDTKPSNKDHNCPSNYDKKPEDYEPLMSLISGRGEAAEVRIASKFILEDMTSLAEKLGVIEPSESQTSSIFLDLNELVASSAVSNLAMKFLAIIGFCFVMYFLVKKARKTDEFISISSAEMEI